MAGAVFGEVWVLPVLARQVQYLVRLEGELLRAMYMAFHMWRESIMLVILGGRRSIWWGWRDVSAISNDMTCQVATYHSSSPHVTSQPTTLLHLTPQATSWHQNRSHHHHGTAEGWFTAKKWFGQRTGWSLCAHSIGKFFIRRIVLFPFWNFGPRLARLYLYMFFCDTHFESKQNKQAHQEHGMKK